MPDPTPHDNKFDTLEMLALPSGGSMSGASATPPGVAPDHWDSFDAAEALIVASRYALGEITDVRPFRRGSRRSPKILIKCEKGLVILKRLAPGRDDPAHVASNHAVQKALAAAGFPLPRLAHLRNATETFVHHAGHVYELFEAIRGFGYDQSPDQTHDAGRILAQFHAVLTGIKLDWDQQGPSFHKHPAVAPALHTLRARPGVDAATTDSLAEIYARAGHHADAAGLAAWHKGVIHGDWHPGNMAFNGAAVAGVFDYDTLRTAQRAIDLAMGALQFSLQRSESSDPVDWPDAPDEARLRRFIAGYDSFPASIVSRSELEALPWLMVEALIAEPVLQIGARGTFGRLDAGPALGMVERKARWLIANHERVTRVAS
jgi:Ser/Thr protein kinase RdoA (MazF antagonist)